MPLLKPSQLDPRKLKPRSRKKLTKSGQFSKDAIACSPLPIPRGEVKKPLTYSNLQVLPPNAYQNPLHLHGLCGNIDGRVGIIGSLQGDFATTAVEMF